MDNFAPMNTAEVMDRAVHVYKTSFFKQILFSGIYHFVSVYAVGIVGLIITAMLSIVFIGIFSAAGGFVVLLSLLLGGIFILWFSVAQAGHILLSKNAFFGEKVQLKLGMLPRISFRVFFTIIAQVIALIPYVALLILFFAATEHIIIVTFTNFWLEFFIIMFVFVFWVLLFFVYFHIFSLSVAVSVFEKKAFFGALLRSWKLLRREFWKTFGARTLWVLVIGIVWTSIFGIFGLIAGGTEFVMDAVFSNTSAVFSPILLVIFGILSIVTYFIVAPLDGVFHATLYFNQRIKKEGLDIEIKLAKLEEKLKAAPKGEGEPK